MSRLALLLLLPLLAPGLTACTQANTDRTYTGTARYRYERGLEALADGNHLDAIQQFTLVKNRFAYSRYAALAELRTADTYFDQAKHIEAIDAYRTFVQRRPNHPEVPYALYRIGESHFQQRPSDFILFPPTYEKDLGTTKDALRAFETYLQRFPQHDKVPAARERVLEARRTLADYELYVARFYLHDERPASARGRLEVVVRDFEDVADRWRDGARLLIEVLQGLGEDEQARQIAVSLIEKQPASDEADEARRLFPNL
jgi:outer membrane protein assembly factor BamD